MRNREINRFNSSCDNLSSFRVAFDEMERKQIKLETQQR